ncbi:hypothetical protein CFHF_21100 [Caulobacter flavus]|uniref:Uncharacterized protein n=1 Tax=Caulobacter flavus TaxID=1679497 RepID=A0A2N5CNJ8_9CAUL|nr:hypothetical protein C1707_25650 [Caulobacter flavus]PLR08071.1 hypothetical protein CFHF_21100 [Caulobacter flavus]
MFSIPLIVKPETGFGVNEAAEADPAAVAMRTAADRAAADFIRLVSPSAIYRLSAIFTLL